MVLLTIPTSGFPISVIHNYAAGTYNVCTWGSITLSNGQVCQFDYCKTITVEPCPNLCPTCTSFAVVQGECVATATGSFVRQMGFSMTCPIPAGATINATWAWVMVLLTIPTAVFQCRLYTTMHPALIMFLHLWNYYFSQWSAMLL